MEAVGRSSVVFALALVAVPVALSGCIGTDDTSGQSLQGGPEDPRPDLVEPSFMEPVQLGHSGPSAEPTIVAGPGAMVYVEEIGHLWRSADGGRTFEPVGDHWCAFVPDAPVCPPGFDLHDAGLQGTGDGDLAADADGTLYWVGMFNDEMDVPFQVSTDRGETWSEPAGLANGRVDRQWISVGPDGTLYVSWRNEPNIQIRTSPDGGATWSDVVAVAPDGLHGPTVPDPTTAGTVYLPHVDEGAIRLARSLDHGAIWEDLVVHTFAPEGWQDHYTAAFPSAAVDEAGTIYVVWSVDPREDGPSDARPPDLYRVFLAVSSDGGTTWIEPLQLSPEGRVAMFPWVAAGGPGRIAVAWYENENGLPNDAPDVWNVALTESVTADRPEPVFAGGHANVEPIHVGQVCRGGCIFPIQDRSLLDFFEVTVKPDGQPIVAWAADPETARGMVRVFVGGVAEGTPLR